MEKAGIKKVWFKNLDTNHDGYLNREEVRSGLRERSLPCSDSTLASFFAAADTDRDGQISIAEYLAFTESHEAELKSVYEQIDDDGDGKLTTEEVRHGAARLGFQMDSDQLRLFMQRAGHTAFAGTFYSAGGSVNGVATVSFDEFHSFLHLLPQVNPKAIFEAVGAKHIIDHANSESTPPVEIDSSSVAQHVAHAKATGTALGEDAFWTVLCSKLYAGSVAGAISRTATAPIDRLKLVLQAAPPGEVRAHTR
jgi:solute carrier family 25 phosphate transporter 23/24/25/41